MSDPIESAEDFVRLVFADDGIPEYEVEHSNLGRNLADGIRSRDRAVRREALAEAARWLAQKVADVREVTRDCRREAIALKAAGKDWQDAFQRECLSASRCGGFADAEAHFRALATGGSDVR